MGLGESSNDSRAGAGRELSRPACHSARLLLRGCDRSASLSRIVAYGLAAARARLDPIGRREERIGGVLTVCLFTT
jgi:hypothetical protein